MAIEGRPGPHPDLIYNGFSAPQPRRAANGRAGKVLMGGVAASALIGVVLGLASRPAGDQDGARLAPDETVKIEVLPGRAPPVPAATAPVTPLATLPAGTTAPDVVVIRQPAPRPARAQPAETSEPPGDERGDIDLAPAAPVDVEIPPIGPAYDPYEPYEP